MIKSAYSFGFTDSDPDPDGIERRVRLIRLFDGRIYFQMALVMLMDICNVKKEDIIIKLGERLVLKDAINPITHQKEDISIPIDEKGMMYINWAGPGPLEESFHHIPFYALLEYPLVKEEINDYFDEQEIVNKIHELRDMADSKVFPGKKQLMGIKIYYLTDLLESYFWGIDMGEKILEFIDQFIKLNGYSPNMREIGEAVGISSTSHVSYWIDRLVEQGKVTKVGGIARSVRVV